MARLGPCQDNTDDTAELGKSLKAGQCIDGHRSMKESPHRKPMMIRISAEILAIPGSWKNSPEIGVGVVGSKAAVMIRPPDHLL